MGENEALHVGEGVGVQAAVGDGVALPLSEVLPLAEVVAVGERERDSVAMAEPEKVRVVEMLWLAE